MNITVPPSSCKKNLRDFFFSLVNYIFFFILLPKTKFPVYIFFFFSPVASEIIAHHMDAISKLYCHFINLIAMRLYCVSTAFRYFRLKSVHSVVYFLSVRSKRIFRNFPKMENNFNRGVIVRGSVENGDSERPVMVVAPMPPQIPSPNPSPEPIPSPELEDDTDDEIAEILADVNAGINADVAEPNAEPNAVPSPGVYSF